MSKALARSNHLWAVSMIDFESLKMKGLVELEGVSDEQDIVDLASTLGQLRLHPNGERVYTLKPSDGEQSLDGTFSRLYGYSTFPIHTDTAFWSLPARYVIMAMKATSQCGTSFLSLATQREDFKKEIYGLAKKSVFILKNFEGARYVSAYFRCGEEEGIRFDPNCMNPKNKEAGLFRDKIIELAARNIGIVKWTGDKTLIIDNWSVLHGREAVLHEKGSRTLSRIYVEAK